MKLKEDPERYEQYIKKRHEIYLRAKERKLMENNDIAFY